VKTGKLIFRLYTAGAELTYKYTTFIRRHCCLMCFKAPVMSKDKTNYTDTLLTSLLTESKGHLTTGIQKLHWQKSIHPLLKEVAEQMKVYRELFDKMIIKHEADSKEFSSLGKLDEFANSLETAPVKVFKVTYMLEGFGVGSKDRFFNMDAVLEIAFDDTQVVFSLLNKTRILEKGYQHHLSPKELRKVVTTFIDDIEKRMDSEINRLG
jgi:hypothetical protein